MYGNFFLCIFSNLDILKKDIYSINLIIFFFKQEHTQLLLLQILLLKMEKQTKKVITEDFSLLDKWKDFINIENPDEINEEDQDNFLEWMKNFKLPNKPPTLHHLSQFSKEYLKKLKEIKKIDSKCKRCTLSWLERTSSYVLAIKPSI